MENLTRDLLYPAVVALLATFASYKATIVYSTKKKDEQNNERAIDLIDRIIIEFNKILTSSDLIKEDIENNHYLDFKHRGAISNSVTNLHKLLDDIFILRSQPLRLKIIEIVELISIISNEVDAIQRFDDDKQNDISQRENTLREKRQSLELEFLKMGIYFHNGKAVFIDQEVTKKNAFEMTKTKTATEMNTDISDKFDRLTNEQREHSKFIERKKTYIAVKITDMQSQLRETVVGLEDQRKIIEKALEKKLL